MCQAHVVADITYHKRVQSNGFDPQHGGAMTSMHKVYKTFFFSFCIYLENVKQHAEHTYKTFWCNRAMGGMTNLFQGGSRWGWRWLVGSMRWGREDRSQRRAGRAGWHGKLLTDRSRALGVGLPAGCPNRLRWQQHVAEMAATCGRNGSNIWQMWQQWVAWMAGVAAMVGRWLRWNMRAG